MAKNHGGGNKHGGGKHGGGHGGKGHGGKGGKSLMQKFEKSPLIKPLSKKGLRKELKSSARIEFGPEARQLHAEQRASQLQQQRTSDYFDQYKRQLASLQQQSASAFAGAQQGVQGASNAASQYAENLRQKLNAEDAASAQLRGGFTSGANSQTDAASNLIRQNTANAYKQQLGAQGAAEKTYFREKRAIAGTAKVDQLLQEAARGRAVNADLRDLAQRKRKFLQSGRTDLRNSQINEYLGLLQAKVSGSNAKLSAATSRANSKRSAATSRANSKRSAASSRANSKRSNRRLNQQFNKTHFKGGEGKGTKSSGSNNKGKNKNTSHRAVSQMYATLVKADPKKLSKLSRGQIISNLQTKSTTYTREEAVRAYNKWVKKNGGGRKPGSTFHGDHSGGR